MEGPLDATIDHSCIEIQGNVGCLAPTIESEFQFHEGEILAQQQPIDAMMNMWSYYDPYMGDNFVGPSILLEHEYELYDYRTSSHS
jgi:hypothetical protein